MLNTKKSRITAAAVLVVAVAGLVLGFTRPWEGDSTPSSPVAGSYNRPSTGMPNQFRDADPAMPLSSVDASRVYTPVFDCDRNLGKSRATYGDVDKLTPCWNTVVHVIVDEETKPGLAAYTNVESSSVKTVRDGQSDDADSRTNSGEDHWRFTVLDQNNSGMYKADFDYFDGGLNSKHFAGREIYYRLGDEQWRVGGNFDDQSFEKGKILEVVLVSYDTRKDSTLAPVPFNWDKMSKGSGFPHFN